MLTTEIHSDGIATLRLDNERRRNALSIAMRDAISDTLEQWASDDRVRVVVLTGTGTTFCAGFDLKEFAQPDLARTIRDSSRRYHLAVWRFAKPVIAAVNGAALGGGFDLSLLCDLRIATPDAEFGHPGDQVRRAAPIHAAAVDRRRGNRARPVSDRQADRRSGRASPRSGEHDRWTPTVSMEEAKATARVIAEAPQPALEATKRYLASSAGVTFDEAFTVEHDRVFDEFLLGAFGPGPNQ